MKRWALAGAGVIVAGAVLWLAARKPAPPAVRFVRVERETLVSILTTNGKTEPAAWEAVRAARAGRIRRVVAERGARVARGAVLAELDSSDAQTAVDAAQARAAFARAELQGLEQGGRQAEIAQIEGVIGKLQLELEAARRDAAALARLVEKGAASRAESDRARDRVAELETELSAQQKRRATLVAETDLEAARARLREAEAALESARRGLAECRFLAPRAGIVYDLPVREGDWVEAGAVIARVGDIARLKVAIYVDEPELGRVRVGLPVEITWDAAPGKSWKASVEQMPTQITPLGTRMVGEVVAMCENSTMDLPPGANVNVRIRSQVVENAVTVPKAALRRQGNEMGAFVLSGNRLDWRRVEIGAASEVKAEVRSGLRPGDAVALPADRPLAAGMEVRPVFDSGGL